MKHLNQKLVIIAMFLSIFIISCSDNENVMNEVNYVQSQHSDSFNDLLMSIDSINSLYAPLYSRDGGGNENNGNGGTLSARDSADLVKFVDDCGTLAGTAASVALSGTVSIPGSPAAGFALEVLIGAAMSEAGSQLFSAAASMCIGYQIVSNKNNSYSSNGYKGIVDYNADIRLASQEINIPLLNTIGKRHNLFMVKAHKKYGKLPRTQIMGEETLNSILNDCISDIKKAYAEYGEVEFSETFKKHLVSCVHDLMILTEKNMQQQKKVSEFVNEAQDLFINKYGYDKDKVKSMLSLEKLIIDGCNKIDGNKLKNYSVEIGDAINSSDLSPIEKAGAINCAQISVNSSLCWNKK